MWASILTSVVVPLLKDLAFMLFNMFKVRQMRKEKEEESTKKVADYVKDPSLDNFSKLP